MFPTLELLRRSRTKQSLERYKSSETGIGKFTTEAQNEYCRESKIGLKICRNFEFVFSSTDPVRDCA
jgi:hypothetical protein